MSRAFVKETDAEQADAEIIERPQSEHPNYITLQGLEQLKQQLDELRSEKKNLKALGDDFFVRNQLNTIEADLRFLEKRIRCAIPVDIASQSGDEIRFGARVELVDENDIEHLFTIVGEDEVNADQGLISWVSPLGRELLGKEPGDEVKWQRPAGELDLEIIRFTYKQD
jgi:transcription elongation factor GreB